MRDFPYGGKASGSAAGERPLVFQSRRGWHKICSCYNIVRWAGVVEQHLPPYGLAYMPRGKGLAMVAGQAASLALQFFHFISRATTLFLWVVPLSLSTRLSRR